MSGFIENCLGIKINGNEPHDIQVYNRRFYRDILLNGTLGLGESYVKGYWDVEDLYAFHVKILTNPSIRRMSGSVWPVDVWNLLKEKIAFVSHRKAQANVEFHYDLGNHFYEIMLGKTMQYTSAYFPENDTNLDHAQEMKFDLVADKLKVFAGCTVLEIGCGWGVLAKYLAEKRGCHVVAITVSPDQYRYCIEHNSSPQNGSVQFVHTDFRNTEKYVNLTNDTKFDRIVGIGTIAHFVPMFKSFVSIICNHLQNGGLALIDDVCRDITCRKIVPSQSSWTSKYIFPGTQFFSPDTITKYFKNKLIIEKWSTDRNQYRDTCLAWLSNIESAGESIKNITCYDERFMRIWRYYLTSAAAGFEAGFLGQWQIVLSKMSHPYQANSRLRYN